MFFRMLRASVRGMNRTEIVLRAADGDERAWAELVTRYTRLLRSQARDLRMRPCDADDAAQQTWNALRGHIHRLREPEHVQAWLCLVMRRNCVRILVRQRAELLDNDPDARRENMPAVPADPVVFDETAAALWATVDRLPDRECRLVRALFDGEERSYAEIARALAMPIGSIGPVRLRALRRLPAMLADAGVTVEDLRAIA
jgi:RNA polymerase sigma factor (sigma-70 family)